MMAAQLLLAVLSIPPTVLGFGGHGGHSRPGGSGGGFTCSGNFLDRQGRSACSFQGSCVRGQCHCDSGFSGSRCQTGQRPGGGGGGCGLLSGGSTNGRPSSECHNYGVCDRYQCTCTKGFSGAHCESDDRAGPPSNLPAHTCKAYVSFGRHRGMEEHAGLAGCTTGADPADPDSSTCKSGCAAISTQTAGHPEWCCTGVCCTETRDCNGVWGGTATADACDVCGGDRSSCADCNGVPHGSATTDNCGTCVAPDAAACTQDCQAVWGGIATDDRCGVCDGDNACVGCDDVPYSGLERDNCGGCFANVTRDGCAADCKGVWGGDSVTDLCGVCGGNSSTCTDCNGKVHGPAVMDACGVCGGANNCTDCNGTATGNATRDECGRCVAPDEACAADCNRVWGGSATLDGCGVCNGDNHTCAGCDGVPNSGAERDECGACLANAARDGCTADCRGVWGGDSTTDLCNVCGGNSSSCRDCRGEVNGHAKVDACGVCGGHCTPPASCPPRSKAFARQSGLGCDVVSFVGVVDPYSEREKEKLELWEQGLQLHMRYTNERGGLRLGQRRVGYVNVSLLRLPLAAHSDIDIVHRYSSMCRDPLVHVLLAPIDSERATEVARQLHEDGCEKPVLAAEVSDELFATGYRYLYSVYGLPSQWAGDPIDVLHQLGARKFAIVGEQTLFTELVESTMKQKIEGYTDSREVLPAQLVVGSLAQPCADALQAQPDVLIGLGDIDIFKRLLETMIDTHKAPAGGAFFVNGLATTARMRTESYTRSPNCTECWVYEQWMGTVPWAANMQDAHHAAGSGCDASGGGWPAGLPDRYNERPRASLDSHGSPTGEMEGDCGYLRYMGCANGFAARARRELRKDTTWNPTHYHAQAAASMLMLQMAVELAPEGQGWGLTLQQLRNATVLRRAMLALNVSSFWGQLKLHESGYNEGFTMGVAQFQDDEDMPKLVGPPTLEPTATAQYPAQWPCELRDSCEGDEDPTAPTPAPKPAENQQSKLWEDILLVIALASTVLLLLLVYRRRSRRPRRSHKLNALEVGLLSSQRMPDALLAQKDVQARWAEAARQHPDAAGFSPLSAAAAAGTAAKTRRRRHGGSSPSRAAVMFTDAHVRELKPSGWRCQVLGKGNYGVVYRATWRNQTVAVKEVVLPKMPQNLERARSADQADLTKQLSQVTTDFVSEVEVAADLAHQNIVRMLGYATKPSLLLVQELCPGGSLDKALYVERWRPSPTQALRCALDIAEGMEYLHTAFEASDCGVERAIVHRDLKSPNLLLHNAPPPSGEEGRVLLKIGDLGLSRDKHLDSLAETSKMTGCGSILWMAPEILMQKVYNEKVDVYSFAMCLVEMLDCQLPWTGCGSAAGVPYKVSKGGRPEQQLQGKERTHGEWVALVRECWEQDPERRLSFSDVVPRLSAALLDQQHQQRVGAAAPDDGEYEDGDTM